MFLRLVHTIGLRVPYNGKNSLLLERDIVKDPFELFQKWFEEAKNNSRIIEPNAMCLASATRDGIPSARYVLCKAFGKEGFRFFTHYTSRKGNELEENPRAALTFFWKELSKSVRIEGNVEKLPMIFAEEYFNGRPYASQIGALCSDQSKVVESRTIIEDKALKLRQMYKEGEVPKPQHWGGYVVIPKVIEFWQGQTDRIHDRIKFRLPNEDEFPDNKFTFAGDNGWLYERLQP